MPERPSNARPSVAGPDHGPVAPFPIRLSGPIIKGFGRGSAELGIPTANIPIEGLSVGGQKDVESGVYYGWCGMNVDEHGKIETRLGKGDGKAKGLVFEAVLSIGFNPFYGNSVRSVTEKEVHVMHEFKQDFYGARMNLSILGFIRPEYDYVSKEKLVEDIRFDIEVARKSLTREAYANLRSEQYLLEFEGEGHDNEVAT